MSRAGGRILIILTYSVVFFCLLPAFLSVLGWRLDELFEWPRLGRGWQSAGFIIGGLGLVAGAWTMLYLGSQGRGWPISHLPPERFVANGPYRIVRHPIYVAYTGLFVGAGLVLGSPGHAFGAGTLLCAGWLIYALSFEEPKLIHRFGESYAEYRRTVPVLRLPGRHLAVQLAARVWARMVPGLEALANRVVLFRVGPSVWVTYGAFLGLGGGVMAAITGGLLVRGGYSPIEAVVYLTSLAVAALVGGRMVWLIYQARPFVDDPIQVFRTVGFVSWGAILAAGLFPFAFAAVLSRDPLWLMDRTMIGLLACGVLGRIGCLTYGCCFGRVSEWGICWTHPDAKLNRSGLGEDPRPRVPTQLIESAWMMAVLLLAILVTRSAAPSGVVAGIILLLYAVGRFASDCLREEGRFIGWRLTSGQIGSLLTGLSGAALLFAAGGNRGWVRPAYEIDPTTVFSVAPAILACAVLVFLVSGFHWRRVGRW